MKVFGIDVGEALTAVAITAAIIYTGGAAAAAMGVGGVTAGISFAAALGQAAIFVGGSLVLQKLSGANSVGDPGRLITQRNSTDTRKVIYGRSRVSGTIVAMGTSDTNKDENKFLHMYIALAAHEVQDIEAVYFDDEKVWYDSAGTKVYNQQSSYWDSSDGIIYYIDHRLGGSDNSTYIAVNTDNNLGQGETGATNLTAEWTANHKFTDVAYIYVRLRFDANFFPNGLPNITAVVKGKKLYNPSDASTAFSSNPALCILDYLRDNYYGLNISNDEIDLTSFASAATICDQSIALDSGGSESRYSCNGIIDLSRKPSDVLADLLTSCAGELFYTNGKFVIKAGAYESPTISLDESNILGSITATTKPSVRDGYNGVKGLYAEPNLLWQPLEYPVLKSSLYTTIDGYENFLTLDLNYTTSGTMAQRLSKIALNKSRQEVSIQFQTDLKGLQLSVGDTFNLTSTKLGYTNKVFQIREMNIEFSPVLGVTISAVEIASTTYDWQSTEEQSIIAETAFFTGQGAVNPPTNLSVSSTLVTQPSNVQEVSWVVSWTASTSRNIANYEVQWKKSTDANYSSTFTSDTSLAGVGGVVSNQAYDVRVRTVSSSGQLSDYDTTTHTMAGGMATFTDGADGADGANGANGADGAGTYTYDLSSGTTSGLPSSTVNGYFTGSGGANRSPVTSDVLIVKKTDDSEATAYIYGGSTWAEQVGGYFHGDVLIEGTLTVDRLKSGNLANNNNISFEIGSGVAVGGYSTVAAFKTGDASNLALVAETSVNYPAFAVGGYNLALHAAGVYNGTGSNYPALNSFCEFSTNTTVTVGSSNYTVSLRTGGNSAYSAWQDNGLTVLYGGRARYSATSLSFANPTTVTSNTGYVITNFGNTSTTDTSLAFDTGFYYNYSTNTIHFPNSASPFTGSHEALIDLSLTPDVGDIMVDSQVIEKGNISNVLTKVVKSSSVNQRTAIGVYVSRIDVIPEVLRVVTQTPLSEEPDPDNPPNDVTVGIKQGFADTLSNNDVCLVNALGEGQINVCNEGGDIVAGDLIVTSTMAGKGMKQSDDILRSMTVAKARESATFSSDTEVKQIACIYLCG